MATLDTVKGVLLQMQHEDSPFLTWGAPGCAVLPDGTFFVIAHTEFNQGYTSSNPAQGSGTVYLGNGVFATQPIYYGFQTWRLDADLNVLDYQLYDQLDQWSPLYVVPLEDYVVQVHMGSGYSGDPPSRTILFDCRNGGAAIMANYADESRPSITYGTYSFLYTTHLTLREFGIIALSTYFGVHLYRRGQCLGSATYEELGFDWRSLSTLGMHPHPSDPTKFALLDWDRGNDVTAYEVTVEPSTGGLSAEKLWTRSWASNPSDWVQAVTSPYADQVWGWVSDNTYSGTGDGDGWYLRELSTTGPGISLWDRVSDYPSDNNVVRTITPNLMVAALEMYDDSGTVTADGPNYGEEFWIGVCAIDTGHGAPSAKMIGLSRRDLVLGPGVPFMGYEDIDDVRDGSQYAPAYRDGTLLMASCPVWRRSVSPRNDYFPVLVWKLEGVGHAEFGVSDDVGKFLPMADQIGPGRIKVRTDDGWWESVSVETWDQEWKPLKINVAEDGQTPVWRTVALLTPSAG